MKTQRYVAMTPLMIAAAMLFALMGMMVSAISADVVPVLAAPLSPSVTSVSPNSVSNDVNVPIVIDGSGFTATLSGTVVITPPLVYLDDVALADPTWINSTTLSATVPWGLDPGIYTLTVVNPDAESGSLTEALTVTQGIGVWTTGGPYGGTVNDMAVHPVLSRTVFAALQGRGLYRSTDGGSAWQGGVLVEDPNVSRVAYGPHPSDTLYVGAGMGLLRSLDDGLTWEAIYTASSVSDFVLNPLDDLVFYVADMGVLRTEDGGQTWEPRNTGLTSPGVRHLYINPLTPTILYATTNDGHVFKTIDEGGTWFTATKGLTPTTDQVYQLDLNPYDPNDVWAMRGRGHVGQFARSVDGGATWEDVDGPFLEMVEDVAFSPLVSTTLYAGGAHELYRSTDGGDTWSFLSTDTALKRLMIQEIALDQTTGVPLYVSGGGGFYRSQDGGLTWERAVYGLDGIEPWFLESSPTNPEIVYSMYDGDAYYSQNGGSRWGFAEGAQGAMAAAFDPSNGMMGYMVGWWGLFAETDDGGISWNVRSNTGHPANHISAISVHPADRDLIFIGGGDHWEAPGNGDGWLARSPDRGDSWQDLDVGQTISNVTSIVFDPVTTDTVYIGTCTIHPYWDRGGGSGVFKSTDGGDGWSPANTGLTYRCVRDLVIRPDRPQVLLAAINDPSPGAVGVFKSVDGGETWHASDAGLESSQVLGLTLDPLQPSHIYAATWGGLFLSTDGGATWQRVQGSLGLVPVFSVSASAYEERTRVYVGVLGGAGATMANRQVLASNVAAGVYQMTVVHRQLDHSIYLPLVTRSG